MIRELTAKKERLELELRGIFHGLKSGNLENWEKKAFAADAIKIMNSLEHTTNCIEIYS